MAIDERGSEIGMASEAFGVNRVEMVSLMYETRRFSWEQVNP